MKYKISDKVWIVSIILQKTIEATIAGYNEDFRKYFIVNNGCFYYRDTYEIYSEKYIAEHNLKMLFSKNEYNEI